VEHTTFIRITNKRAKNQIYLSYFEREKVFYICNFFLFFPKKKGESTEKHGQSGFYKSKTGTTDNRACFLYYLP